MISANKAVLLTKNFTVRALRDYILDNELSEPDTTILVHQTDYDELALDYRSTYNEHLPDPYVLLGVLIKEDVRGVVRPRFIVVVENDTESMRERPIEVVDPYRVIYRCGFCGNVVDYNGAELDPEERDKNIEYLQKFGNQVTVNKAYGDCCAEQQGYVKSTVDVSKPKHDYAALDGKALMELTEEDFERIGLHKGNTPDFEVIYSCDGKRGGKIYFTPNESTYSLRGFRLREYEQILTTEQLVKAVREWRRD